VGKDVDATTAIPRSTSSRLILKLSELAVVEVFRDDRKYVVVVVGCRILRRTIQTRVAEDDGLSVFNRFLTRELDPPRHKHESTEGELFIHLRTR